MQVTLTELLDALKTAPQQVEFDQVMAVINACYHYQPTRFVNGLGDAKAVNEAGTNEGSCKIFAFAQLQNLTEAQTLACFGKFYREDVLLHPEANDHANIRNFMQSAWQGITFDAQALTAL